MKFSREWLQSYIKEPLPSKEIIDDVISRKAFEVEGVEIINADEIYDIKVLPNRHGDALSHYFMAKEFCALLKLTLLNYKNDVSTSQNKSEHRLTKIKIEDEKSCFVFETVHIDGVDSRESPEWMRLRLESIGQRSINAIVDITNYVQFAINKPMHAYDAREVKGGFLIRYANKGEKLTALDGIELELDTETLVIADNEKVLGLAGIKGGMYSGIKAETKSIILESANFDSILIRQTAKKYGMHSDASKRFEAGQSSVLVRMGTELAINLYKEIFGNDIQISEICRVGKSVIDIENQKIKINTSLQSINANLGGVYSNLDVEEVLDSYSFNFENTKYTINVPLERVDLKIEADIIEEVGRALGYDTLKPVLPKIKNKDNQDRYGKYNSHMYLEMALRHALYERGYDEVITYTLTDKGDVFLENSIVGKTLRNDISDGLIKSFYKNLSNAPLMQLDVIRGYEIGSVFTIDDEYRHIAIICDDNKKKSNFGREIETLIKEIETELFSKIDDKIKINFKVKSEKPYTIEINLTELLAEQIKYTKAEENKHGGMIDLGIDHDKEWKYKHLSVYPITTRDVSVFYPETASIEGIQTLIGDTIHASTLVKKFYLVDSFEKKSKDGTVKRSAAFRIVYQSDDRTLTDDEVNAEVSHVYQALKVAGCELR